MTSFLDEQLKKFILAELRESSEDILYKIINKSHIEYIYTKMMSYSSSAPECEIMISEKKDYDLIMKNMYHYENILKPIIAYAKNIELKHMGHHSYFYVNVKFKFNLKEWEDIDIANINEDVGILENDKQKMIRRFIEGDYDGSLTSAKSLLESVFKIYLDNYLIPYDKKNEDFSQLQKLVMQDIEKDKPSHYKRVINGIKSICTGIDETRNKDSDSHGSNPEERNIIDHDILKVIIETAISITNFITKQI